MSGQRYNSPFVTHVSTAVKTIANNTPRVFPASANVAYLASKADPKPSPFVSKTPGIIEPSLHDQIVAYKASHNNALVQVTGTPGNYKISSIGKYSNFGSKPTSSDPTSAELDALKQSTEAANANLLALGQSSKDISAALANQAAQEQADKAQIFAALQAQQDAQSQTNQALGKSITDASQASKSQTNIAGDISKVVGAIGFNGVILGAVIFGGLILLKALVRK